MQARARFFYIFSEIPSPAEWLGHRQISPSPSYLHDMTFLACGACVTSSIVPNAIRVYPPCRPARSASPALDVPSVCAIRMATNLRPFPEILFWTQKGGDISAAALFLLLQGNLIARLSPHLLPLQGIHLLSAKNEDLTVTQDLFCLRNSFDY